MKRTQALMVYGSLLVAIAVADLVTKPLVFDMLRVQVLSLDDTPTVFAEREHPVIPGFFTLQAAINLGAFNGMLAGQTWFLISVSVLAVLVTTFLVAVAPTPSGLMVFALGCVAGGALGNLYDRAALGYVRDFLKVFVVVDGKERVWPNFNVADSAICVGFGLVILSELLALRARRQADRAQPAGTVSS